MRIDGLLIALVVVSMITIGTGAFISDLTSTYDIDTSPQFEAQFNKFNDTYSLTEDISDNVKGASVGDGESDFDIADTLKSAISVVKVVFVQGIPAIFSSLTNLGEFLPLPEFVIRGLQAIAFISIAFALVYLYFRYQNT